MLKSNPRNSAVLYYSDVDSLTEALTKDDSIVAAGTSASFDGNWIDSNIRTTMDCPLLFSLASEVSYRELES